LFEKRANEKLIFNVAQLFECLFFFSLHHFIRQNANNNKTTNKKQEKEVFFYCLKVSIVWDLNRLISLNDAVSLSVRRSMMIVEVVRRISLNYEPVYRSSDFYQSKNWQVQLTKENLDRILTFSIRTFFILPSFFKRFRFSSKQKTFNRKKIDYQ